VALGDQEALAGYLHDLGMMLSYRRDEALRKFGVLNPQWVTKGIYEMLNASQIRDAGGRFTLRSFGEVLRPKAYPEALHPYLLALMLRFRLCHPLDTRGGKYLIPESLSKEEPALDSEFPPAECLNFEYHYASVLPEGLLPRFIVESYVHREPRHAWRSGVVLERANCRAMVRGDLQARTVTIRVAGVGNGRRELLGIIREHFERIHSSYEKLPVVARVPIPGHPDVRVDHDLLLTYEREGEREIPVPVGTRLQRFNVIKLLDGVDLPGVTRSVRATRSGASGSPVARTLQLGYTLHEDELRQALSAAGFQEVWPGVRVFVTYSQRDAVFLDQLRAALVPHERLGELKLWCDALLEAGQLWEREILGRLERAQIVILLLSNDFLRSSYCMDQELPRALERQARGQCEIVPILVRACRYEKLELGKIQTIRPGDKSIDEHDKKDPAWVVVTHEIDRVMERIKKRQHDEGTSSNALLLAGSTAPT
jgi:internalin A